MNQESLSVETKSSQIDVENPKPRDSILNSPIQRDPRWDDSRDDDAGIFLFSDATIRRAFIRKVYSIITVQLAISLFFIAMFTTNEDARKFVLKYPQFLYISIAVAISISCIVSCCPFTVRSFPCNYVLLFGFTLAKSFFLGVLAVRVGQAPILLAVGITSVLVFGLTVYAFTTNTDFTSIGVSLCLCLGTLVFIAAGFVIAFFQDVKPLHIGIACFGAILFSFHLIHFTQLLIGGNHALAFSPEDHVFAALMLYIEIINIFVSIVQILVLSSSD